MSAAIDGFCPPGFDAVRRAFAGNFDQGLELGAGFALAVDGEIVVNLWGGWADRDRTRPFGPETLTPVFSTTKAVTSLMLARLVGEGRLDYDRRVAELWPDFAAAGKDRVTVGQLLSHQAGLCGLVEAPPPGRRDDWDAMCAILAAQAPIWPPGTASGYHPSTFGWLAGEIFRLIDPRGVGAALAQDIAGPFDLDVWIGLPDSEHPRCAQIRRPTAMPDLGEITLPRHLAFFSRWASPGDSDDPAWKRAMIPSSNGHATAAGLARLFALMACDGVLDGRAALAPGAAAEAARARIQGPDLVLPFDLAWGAGLLRNQGLNIFGPGAESFGHYGWGGSCVFADPERGISGAYVMNRQSPHLIGDPRAVRLINAAYEGL